MISRTLVLPFVLGLLSSFVACSDDGNVGAPCTEDADCAEGLVCDEHDGQASCQEAHGHDDGDTEDTEHAETEHATEDTAHDSGETGHDSGSTGHESGETGHQHESGETGHATGTDSGTAG